MQDQSQKINNLSSQLDNLVFRPLWMDSDLNDSLKGPEGRERERVHGHKQARKYLPKVLGKESFAVSLNEFIPPQFDLHPNFGRIVHECDIRLNMALSMLEGVGLGQNICVECTFCKVKQKVFFRITQK